MSSPIRLRSSDDARLFSQSRTGSPPASVRKKIAGICFPCLSSVPDAANISVGNLDFLPTRRVYHIRYARVDNFSQRNYLQVTKPEPDRNGGLPRRPRSRNLYLIA